jgi:molybdate transport system substrate-binding protein
MPLLCGVRAENGANIGAVIASAVRRRQLVGLPLALVALCCERSRRDTASAPSGELVVFAAASLRGAFTALGAEFERAQAGAKLTFNFAGTQELRTQLEHGAPCDVFASADQHHMRALVDAGRVEQARIFARNELVLVVAKDSVEAPRTFGNLPQARRLVIGAPEVPVGRYTLQLLERAAGYFGPDFRARVEANVVSRELNVKQVLAKVSLGEASAGIVYRTDAKAAADRVSVVTIPPYVNVVAEYPIAVAKHAPHVELARAWVELVLSHAGKSALETAGFLPPDKTFKKP